MSKSKEEFFIFKLEDRLPRFPKKRPDWCRIVIRKKPSKEFFKKVLLWVEKSQSRGTEIEIDIPAKDAFILLAYELGADRLIFNRKQFQKLLPLKKKYFLLLADSLGLAVQILG